MAVSTQGNVALHRPASAAERLARAHTGSGLNAIAAVLDRPLSGEPAGVLAGVPFVAKDNMDVAGVPVTCGSRHFEHRVPDHTATCVQRLLDSGGVLIGTSLCHEFAYGCTGDSSATGPGLNPVDPARIAGGSSAGSASAVALGIVPVALASDTGGSARIPASLCGVFGFKPTYGRVPTDGVFPLSPTMDVVGLMAATPEDLRLGWTALTGDPGDVPENAAPPRVGLLTGPGVGVVDAQVQAVVREALIGFGVRETVLENLPRIGELYPVLQGREATTIHRQRLREHPELFQPDVRDRLEAAATVTAHEYVAALAARELWQREALAVFADVEVLALPTTPITAPLLGARDIAINGTQVPVRDALLSLTRPWSILGWPAVSVPGLAVAGLPVGIQLVGPPGSDARLINLAAQLHQPFYGNEWASAGLILGTVLEFVLNPKSPVYGSGQLPAVLVAQVLTATLGILVFRRKWAADGRYPTFIPIVSVAPAIVLVFGATPFVIATAGVLGALTAPPVGAWIGSKLPAGYHPFIGYVMSMTICSTVLVLLLRLIPGFGTG